ncbi:hypothetical protein SCLCIDRAFT_1215397 [Scleroderma citrinum Foug A]|uniref:Uncharacterized protein n=1 Tax=Scleroderma citrinum Foug A TaxID=1036808 RepID=A0A0C3E0M8_9AGAM|nr:hypothetical protein SCLCIDRAFT_1215397 [Scleroderma citrinum Foug A]
MIKTTVDVSVGDAGQHGRHKSSHDAGDTSASPLTRHPPPSHPPERAGCVLLPGLSSSVSTQWKCDLHLHYSNYSTKCGHLQVIWLPHPSTRREERQRRLFSRCPICLRRLSGPSILETKDQQ